MTDTNDLIHDIADAQPVRRIRIGGLLRCCAQSARLYDGPEEVGVTVIPCSVGEGCTTRIRLASDGVWEWDV